MLHYRCMKKVFLLFLALIWLGACNSYHKVTVVFPNGFNVVVRIADTPEKIQKGLMFVTDLPENEGMLFLFNQEDDHYFWMKNTLIDLDIIYLSSQGNITQLYERVPRTYTYTPEHEIPVVLGRGQYVLEVPAGTITRQNLKEGDQLLFNL